MTMSNEETEAWLAIRKEAAKAINRGPPKAHSIPVLMVARVRDGNPEMPSLVKDVDQPTVQAARGSSRTAPAGPPASKEATVTGDQGPSMEKMKRDEMRYEVCQFAHAMLRRGNSPLLVVQALIDGMLAFAGRIGEEAMRNHIGEADYCDYYDQRSREKAEKRDDGESIPF